MKSGLRKGSPPLMFNFNIPASASSRKPRLASSMGKMEIFFVVWKQKSQASVKDLWLRESALKPGYTGAFTYSYIS